MALEDILDHMQAPRTVKLAKAYKNMVDAEESWVQHLNCLTWQPLGTLRRTLCLVSPDEHLPDMKRMLAERAEFLAIVRLSEPRAGGQSTSPPVWILPNGTMPVTEGRPIFNGRVTGIRWRKATAFRSGHLKEHEVHEYLEQRLQRLEGVAANYGKRRQREKEAAAKAAFEQARAEIDRARELLMTAEGPFVGRLISGESTSYSAKWSHLPKRTQFTLQHVALLPCEHGTGPDIVEPAPERPGRHSSWGEPIVTVLNVQIFGRQATVIDGTATEINNLPQTPAGLPAPKQNP